MLVVNKRTGQVEEFSTFEHYMDDELRERVAHENILIPEEYSKVEIEKEEVVHYIKNQ